MLHLRRAPPCAGMEVGGVLLTCVKSGGTPGHRWDPHHAQEGPKSSLLILLFVFFLRPLMHRCIKVEYRDILHIGSYIDCFFFFGAFAV